MKRRNRHPLIMGTLILTVTGLISRTMGFFYRIYLSRLFGEEGMGIYQLLSPVLALSFSLTAAGYQTAISKFVAERSAKEGRASLGPMAAGLSISLPLSVICCGVIFCFSDFIARALLLEPRTASMLRILAFSVPLSAVHSCINGYFYGIQKAGVPALSQLSEQLARVGCVYLLSTLALRRGLTPSINVAVLGLTVGELISMLISLGAVYLRPVGMQLPAASSFGKKASSRSFFVYRSILGMALPLTANRIVLNLLQSIEAVSIPARLKLYGYDTATALSVYGVLTGMAMPLIFFPNALTSAVSVLLLPLISENRALGNKKAVRDASLRTVKYCFLLGFVCLVCFGLFGNLAGRVLFHSALAGHFITTLSFICPFIYLDTTLSSILQGLGMAGRVFLMNAACLLLRLAFVFFAVPCYGITGYLWGMLASQLLLGLLYLSCLFHFCRPDGDAQSTSPSLPNKQRAAHFGYHAYMQGKKQDSSKASKP